LKKKIRKFTLKHFENLRELLTSISTSTSTNNTII